MKIKYCRDRCNLSHLFPFGWTDSIYRMAKQTETKKKQNSGDRVVLMLLVFSGRN